MSKTSSEKPQGKNAQEYSIRVPKHIQKRYHVMRFNGSLEIDFGKWTSVKMERENNLKEYKGIEEDTPKYGAGSEFGKEAKDEARRKKLGIITKKYKPDDQPWILKSVGSTVKKFKGIREGGVSENASYYVFTHAADGAIEAFPLHEWYKFQPIQRYKALSAEEAEEEFTKRNKNINFFSLMLRKRLKGDEGDETLDDGEEIKGKKGGSKKSKELKISDMDEWMESSEDDSSNDEDEAKIDEEKNEKKKKDKKAADNKRKKPKRDTDLEAFEDSDDGDGEGRELDYISDSSESEPEQEVTKLQGVAEEKGMMKMLNSDEGTDEDSEKEEKQDSNEEEEKKKEEENKEEAEPKNKEKSKKKKLSKKDILRKELNRVKDKDSSSDFSPDSSTDDENSKSSPSKKLDKNKDRKNKDDKEKESNSANSSRSASPITDGKRKLNQSTENSQPSKKVKLEMIIPGMSESGITEESVRRYLMRKPMTTTELLQKCKSKKTGLSSDQLVNIMTQILKKINPTKQMIKGKMHLSIK